MKVYERIMQVRSGRWEIGVIDDHQARPLTEEEMTEALAKLNAKPDETPAPAACDCGRHVDGEGNQIHYPPCPYAAPAGDDPLWKAGDVDLDAISKPAPADTKQGASDYPPPSDFMSHPAFVEPAPPEAARRWRCLGALARSGDNVTYRSEQLIDGKCPDCGSGVEPWPVVEDPSAGGGKA